MLDASALTFSLFSILLLVGIGLVGFYLQENGLPLTPAILAAALLPLLKLNLRRARRATRPLSWWPATG